jgi:hypothetical protein
VTMEQITNDTEFRHALAGLDAGRQRAVAALFVKDVLPLCDDERIAQVTEIAAREDAPTDKLAEALRTARATTTDCHARCGAEGDWKAQAGYFVARAAVAALTPAGQLPGGQAWQAAMSGRMAKTCESIVTGEDLAGRESTVQYRILTDFLNS